MMLGLAVVSLVFQLFPSTWWLVGMLDAREWSRLLNLAFVLVLVVVRVTPEIKATLATRRDEAARRLKREQRKQAAKDREARWSRRIR